MKSLNDISKSYSHGPVNLPLRNHQFIKEGTVWRATDPKVIKETDVEVKLFADIFMKYYDNFFKIRFVKIPSSLPN